MAGVTKVNGKYHTEELISRDLFFKEVGIAAAAAMSQVDFDRVMQNVSLTSTIEVIGTFVADTSTAVSIVISGADVTSLDGTDTIADIAGF